MGATHDRWRGDAVDCTTCAQGRDVYSIDVLGETAALHLGYRPGWARTWDLRVGARRRLSGWNKRWKAERRFPPESRCRAASVATLAARRLIGNDRIAHHLGHGPHVRRCLEAIETGGPPPVSPADAARSVEAVLAFYRSAHQVEVIHIEPREMRATP